MKGETCWRSNSLVKMRLFNPLVLGSPVLEPYFDLRLRHSQQCRQFAALLLRDVLDPLVLLFQLQRLLRAERCSLSFGLRLQLVIPKIMMMMVVTIVGTGRREVRICTAVAATTTICCKSWLNSEAMYFTFASSSLLYIYSCKPNKSIIWETSFAPVICYNVITDNKYFLC